MLSKRELKLLTSLRYKKYRDINRSFLIEGEKVVLDFCDSKYDVLKIYFSTDVQKNKILQKINIKIDLEFIKISHNEMKKISLLSQPNKVMALVKYHKDVSFNFDTLQSENILVLDNIQDPRNLGSLVRVSHWYGVNKIVCSKNTVDLYNPKVIQSSMGSLSSVNIFYLDIIKFLKHLNKHSGFKIYTTALKGGDVQKTIINDNFVVILGNESKGVSKEILNLQFTQITIPKVNIHGPDSLNIVSAYSIIISNFCRYNMNI